MYSGDVTVYNSRRFSLPNSHLVQKKCFEVMLQLTRVSLDDMRPCEIYDRGDDNYDSFWVYPTSFLDGFGPLNYTILDIPTLSRDTHRSILFNSFRSSSEGFDKKLSRHLDWFEEKNAEEFITIKTVIKYIDKVSSVKLQRKFIISTLTCYIYHLAAKKRDVQLSRKLRDPKVASFINCIRSLAWRNRGLPLALPPVNSDYNFRIMHQISQLYIVIITIHSTAN